jgi:hypothetical protein
MGDKGDKGDKGRGRGEKPLFVKFSFLNFGF